MRTGKYDINTVHQTNNCGVIEVIGIGNSRYRIVRFVNTGTVTEAQVTNIRLGKVRDPYNPVFFGVGFLGEPMEHPLRKDLEVRWRNMLNRVYNFKTGKSISPDWLCFANFLRDALELPGFELLQEHSKANRIDLDSDIIPLSKGTPPFYSKETCQWVRHAENVRACEHPTKHTRRPIGTIIETKHGPVTIIAKNNQKWLIRFSDGAEKWVWRVSVLNDSFGKPSTSEA